jgi:hypothetical protein
MRSPEEHAADLDRQRARNAAARADTPTREAQNAAQRAARAHRHSEQGPFVAAAPDNMPSDAYLNTFESNVTAAAAAFYARMGNWRFSKWEHVTVDDAREECLAEASAFFEGPEGAAAPRRSLTAAIEEEGRVEDEDIERCMRNFYARMNPGVRVVVCGACGVYDVPIVPLPAAGDSPAVNIDPRTVPGVLRFFVIDDIENCFLDPLHYTDEEKAKFELRVPVHKTDTADNARRYKEHKRAVSVVQCSDVDGGAGGALMHLLPAAVSPALVLCAPDDDPNGEPVPVQVTRADGRPVLQTTLCASCRDALRKAERPKARRAGPACGRGAPSAGSFYAPT